MATKYITLTNLGTFLDQLKSSHSATETNYGGIKLGYKETGQNYPVQLGTEEPNIGKAYVNVPWKPGEFKLDTASSSVLGGIKIGYKSYADPNTYKAGLLLGTEEPNIGKAYVNLSVANADNAGLLSAALYNKLYKLEQYVLPTATNSKLGGVKIGSNITVGTDGTISLDSSNITDALGYTPADEKNTSSGGGMVELTWEKLFDMWENGQLSPGTKYRIIDYKTVVNSTDAAVSIENSFDIIVEAISTNELSENAKACLRDGDTYFRNSNLSAWELKYCIENDTNRFGWADNGGKGVIYYMKDEWGNEAPYDFKNIKMSLDSDYILNPSNNYFFTFSKVSDVRTSSPTISDASLDGTARFNIIKPSIYGEDDRYSKLLLNKIVCIYDDNEYPYYNQSSEKIIGNYFDYNCYNITLLGSPQYNKFGTDCYNIVIGGPDSKNNIFGKNCESIYLSKITFHYNNYIKKTAAADQISYNKFGDNCSNITSTTNFHSNTFGNNCKHFNVLTNFMSNRIYDNCIGWEFGNYCMKNIIESNNYTEAYWEIVDLIENDSPVYQNSPYKNVYAKLQIHINDGSNTGKYITADWVCDCVFGKNSRAIIKFAGDTFVDDDDSHSRKPYISKMIKNLYFHDLIDNTINIGDYDDNYNDGDNIQVIEITSSIINNNYLNSPIVIHVTRDHNSSTPKYGFYTPMYSSSININ